MVDKKTIDLHIEQMSEIIADVIKTLGEKRHDYGLSFDKSVKKHGGLAYELPIEWKLNRIHTFHERGVLKNESLEDALRDIIGYSLLYWRILKHESP